MSASHKSQRIRQERPFSQTLLIFLWQSLPWGALVFGSIAGIGLFLWLADGRKADLEAQRQVAAAAAAGESVAVEVRRLAARTFHDRVVFPGEVRAWEAAEIFPEVTGMIIPLDGPVPYRSEGDWVKQGDLLARIDERDYRATLEDADSRLKLATVTHERSRRLLADGALTAAAFDQDTATYRQAVAARATAALNLERCIIRAPFDGVINRREFALGSLVGPSGKLFDLFDIRRVKVRVGVPQSDVTLVRNVKDATVRVDGFDRPFPANVHFLSYNTLEMAKVYALELELDNSDRLLRPGMMVDVTVVRETKENAILVPLYTILTNGTEQYCYVIEGTVSKRRNVRVGRISGTEAEILEGLSPGDDLVIKGQRQCMEGSTVSIVRHEGLEAPAPSPAPEGGAPEAAVLEDVAPEAADVPEAAPAVQDGATDGMPVTETRP